MPEYGKWQTVRELGRGGQGKVFLARDTAKYRIEDIARGITNSVIGIGGRTQQEYQDSLKKAHDLAKSILRYSQSEDAEHCGVLKMLHEPEDMAGYPGEQIERMKREV